FQFGREGSEEVGLDVRPAGHGSVRPEVDRQGRAVTLVPEQLLAVVEVSAPPVPLIPSLKGPAGLADGGRNVVRGRVDREGLPDGGKRPTEGAPVEGLLRGPESGPVRDQDHAGIGWAWQEKADERSEGERPRSLKRPTHEKVPSSTGQSILVAVGRY